jgi:predicted SprT family Zn-dependent metalloprotease
MYHQRVEQGEQTENRLQRIARAFDMVNRTYFGGVIPTPSYRVSTRMTFRAGKVFTDEWVMVISVPYHERYGWDGDLVCTVKHEAVHLYLAHMKRPDGHTDEFKEICARIGGSLRGKPMPRRRPWYRYLLQCPHCQCLQQPLRWCKGLACRACCDKYNDGRHSPQFVFKVLRRTQEFYEEVYD